MKKYDYFNIIFETYLKQRVNEKHTDALILEMLVMWNTICISSCHWARSAEAGLSSRCGSWCHNCHRAADARDRWPDRTPRTRCTPNTASLYSAPPSWSEEQCMSLNMRQSAYEDKRKNFKHYFSVTWQQIFSKQWFFLFFLIF